MSDRMTKTTNLNLRGSRGTRAFAIVISITLVALAGCGFSPSARAQKKPVIRAITAFTNIDPTHFEVSLHETVTMLKTAKASFEQAGYTVQTIRITSQPFSSIVDGMTHEEAIEFFNKYAAAVEKEGVISAIGPAFLHDPDHAWVQTFAEVLAAHPSLDGCVIVANENGIRWPAIHEASF